MAPSNAKGARDKEKQDDQSGRRKDKLIAEMMIGQGGKNPGKKEANEWITVKSSLKKKLDAAAGSKGMAIEVKKEFIQSSNELYLTKQSGDNYFNKLNEVEEVQNEEMENEIMEENMSVEEDGNSPGDTEMEEISSEEELGTEEVVDITEEIGVKHHNTDEPNVNLDKDVDMKNSEIDGNKKAFVVKRKISTQHNEQSPKKKTAESKKGNFDTVQNNALQKIHPGPKRDTNSVTPEKIPKTKKQDWMDLEEQEDIDEEKEKDVMIIDQKKYYKVDKIHELVPLEEYEKYGGPRFRQTAASIKWSKDATPEQKAKARQPVFRPVETPKTQTDQIEGNEATKTRTKQVSIRTYAEKIKGRKKTPKENCMRLRFMFNSKKTGDKPQVLHLLTSLMEIANMVDEEAMIMPWNEIGFDNGPIDKNDVIYQNKLSINEAKRYLDLPMDVQRTGFTSGKTEYGLGVRITTSLTERIFKNSWDLTKKDRIQNGKKFIAVKLAELQHSPNAFLVGVVAGSTEGMEIDSINKGLEKETDIKGIGVSYQQFHQPGITPSMWKEANQKAEQVSNDKKSRAFIRAKYSWAPEGLCVYVDSKQKVTEARKKLIGKYGECDDDGNLPIWPGGSRMRFIPLKSSWIKNEKTRNKVEKRVKYHVYCKGNEYEETTLFKNIGDTIPAFEGKTFQEKILDIESEQKPGIKLFRHFKHTWTPDPRNIKWSISAHSIMKAEASKKIQEIKKEMEDTYGSDIEHFFQEERRSMYASRGRPNKPLKFNLEEDDEDDWFSNDNDILSIQEKSIMVEGIPANMGTGGNPEATDASWGSPISYAALSTDSTIMKNKDIEVEGSNDTEVTSTITHSTVEADKNEVRARKFRIRRALTERGLSADVRQHIMDGTAPYDMVMGNFTKQDYNHDLMAELIWTIHQNWQIKVDKQEDPANEESPEPVPDEPPDTR